MNDVHQLEIKIDFIMDEFQLHPNTEHPAQFDGYAEYNPRYFSTPEIDYSIINRTGKLEVKTASNDDDHFDWNKKSTNTIKTLLPTSVPVNLELEFGMGEANIDLTELMINELTLDIGMGTLELTINEANTEICKDLTIETGLGNFAGTGIGLLRPESISIEVGLGDAKIDLSDPIDHDVDIEIEVSLGDVELILPDNVNIVAKVHEHFLSDVDLEDLVKKRNKYVSSKWDDGRPTIMLDISVGVGSIELKIAN